MADRVRLEKSRRTLTLYAEGRAVRAYRVALGRHPVGAKDREGDGRTPEGDYTIDYRNPKSGFHLALHVSYPDSADLRHATTEGARPGGDVMIHGLPNGLGWLGRLHRIVDWTNGCVAVTDGEMNEIYRAVPNGTRIEIRP